MKKILTLVLSLILTAQLFSQNSKNVFKSFSEFIEMKPSQTYDFQLKLRTMGNVVMMGGITNHRIKKAKPKNTFDYLKKEAWGVFVNDSVYINSYRYSRIIGYNKILGKGYYCYFIGEPARFKEEQLQLGIIKEGEPQMAVCCKISYVILPDGSVKWLNLEYLKELISDNSELVSELNSKNLLPEDIYKMFEIIDKYNESKK